MSVGGAALIMWCPPICVHRYGTTAVFGGPCTCCQTYWGVRWQMHTHVRQNTRRPSVCCVHQPASSAGCWWATYTRGAPWDDGREGVFQCLVVFHVASSYKGGRVFFYLVFRLLSVSSPSRKNHLLCICDDHAFYFILAVVVIRAFFCRYF